MQDKNDILIRGVTTDGTVRFIGVTSTGIVERAREIHHLLPLATAALGRAPPGPGASSWSAIR